MRGERKTERGGVAIEREGEGEREVVAWSSTPLHQAASRQPCSAINTRCGEWGYETERGRQQREDESRGARRRRWQWRPWWW